MQIDSEKLNQFLGQVVGEMGAAMNAALVLIGDKLGLYRAMAGADSMTPGQLASKRRPAAPADLGRTSFSASPDVV